ncbi:serine/threonine protein kinase [Aetokthonos hydrillicola Thurmond2011]|jgi:serine/threonine-protein kinase|uniref:non-specific serine/threonine protein kinase n=1 Tax=Aetokthonos hydrillicola Thurmond2011 TaxID=2712845 RepID=A0AAP5IF53_9CYAN|nr:serine/threonine-protein kinase [Aetokthonos hydrillicola]MBO3461698.1 serine/threonine protein kinase [Aetokthonos hydrillicola CCALA 1050]MBW4589996.1 serine/threonine protein kinase [Aetokthonos hydrillicola CCALA 1050]MDR9900578.1 serine/threonine protein kinase [Aetokthonos hydrillicola Thurmond2011]
MNQFSTKIPQGHQEILQQTKLGRLCGSNFLFRERYKILQILGRGGFGVTFLAKDAVLPGSPLCVIKQLCPKTTNSKSWALACDRFEKEAKILGQLGSHSQIPMLLNYFKGNGEFYLVQEYVRGYTLAQEIKLSGIKNEAAVKQFLQEVLGILRYIHKNHVIHRDIKPQNLIRCSDDGRLVLIDFGAVKEQLIHASQSPIDQISSTNFIGTVGFAPPEQFSLHAVYASDIYAVGVTCLYLLTGKTPLELDYDSTTGEIFWQKEVRISENFAGILGKMLKISIQERFHSVDDVIWALKMESSLPSLMSCLTTQPLKDDTTMVEEQIFQKYQPPVARTANAIREWKAKLKARNSQNRLKYFSV